MRMAYRELAFQTSTIPFWIAIRPCSNMFSHWLETLILCCILDNLQHNQHLPEKKKAYWLTCNFAWPCCMINLPSSAYKDLNHCIVCIHEEVALYHHHQQQLSLYNQMHKKIRWPLRTYHRLNGWDLMTLTSKSLVGMIGFAFVLVLPSSSVLP